MQKAYVRQVTGSSRQKVDPQVQQAKLLASAAQCVADHEWEQAADLYSQALDILQKSQFHLILTQQFDTLEKRFTCYRRLGKINAEISDLEAMLVLRLNRLAHCRCRLKS